MVRGGGWRTKHNFCRLVRIPRFFAPSPEIFTTTHQPEEKKIRTGQLLPIDETDLRDQRLNWISKFSPSPRTYFSSCPRENVNGTRKHRLKPCWGIRMSRDDVINTRNPKNAPGEKKKTIYRVEMSRKSRKY